MDHHVCAPLENYVVGTLPNLFYIPNFITEAEQSEILHHIYEVSATRWKNLKNRRLQSWGGVVHEKGLLPQELPSWLSKITKKIYDQTALFPSAINHVLINEYFPDQGILPHQDGPAYFPVASILSLKSPAVIDFDPHPRRRVYSENKRLSECSSTSVQASDAEKDALVNESVFCLKDDRCSLLLMPCSLLIFKDQAYSDYLHGIQESAVHSLRNVINVFECAKLDELKHQSLLTTNGEAPEHCFNRTSTRVSLTCRLVPKAARFVNASNGTLPKKALSFKRFSGARNALVLADVVNFW